MPHPLPTLHTMAEQLSRGEVSSVELTTAALERIDATQPTLNAFRLVRAEEALAEAGDADRRRAAGEQLPLLGVPLAIKDDTDLAGTPTAFGCAGEFPVKDEDAAVVQALRRAGAVIVGKTNTPEFGQWPFTEGRAFGATRNPWNLDYTPGGSSGGSAAAVAAGLVPAAVGSDGAGSIRIPAAWTHLVGVKPQRGRISTLPHPEAFYGLTVHGPLARTVADAAWLLDLLSGSSEGDRHRPPPPAVPFAEAAQREPDRLRVAVALNPPFSAVPTRLDGVIRTGVRRLADRLADLGHDVVERNLPYGLIGASFLPRSEVGLYEWQQLVPDQSLLEPRTRANCRLGRFLGGPLLEVARRSEGLWQRRIGAVFRAELGVDVVLAPTTAQPPLRIGATDPASDRQTSRVIVAACPYTWPWNVLGWPGVNVPAGFTENGLPIGAQLLGPANSEGLLLSLAAQLETVERWDEQVPPTVAEGVPA